MTPLKILANMKKCWQRILAEEILSPEIKAQVSKPVQTGSLPHIPLISLVVAAHLEQQTKRWKTMDH